jgi:hypothetical protein
LSQSCLLHVTNSEGIEEEGEEEKKAVVELAYCTHYHFGILFRTGPLIKKFIEKLH